MFTSYVGKTQQTVLLVKMFILEEHIGGLLKLGELVV